MDVTQEWIAFVILLVGLLLFLYRLGEQKWLLVVSFLSGFCGIVLMLSPPKIYTTQLFLKLNGDLDDTHYILFRALGTSCFGMAVSLYMNRKCPDAYTKVVLFFSMLVASSLQVVVFSLTPITLKKTEDAKGASFENVNWLWFMEVALVAIHILFILLSKDYSGHSQLQSRLNRHLHLDFLFSLIHGVVLIAYPQLVLGRLTNNTSFDEVHILITQVYGAQQIGKGVLSLLYTSVLFTDNKRYLLMSRVLEFLALIVVVVFTNYSTGELGGTTQLTLLAIGIVASNALLGYYAPHETANYVSSKDD